MWLDQFLKAVGLTAGLFVLLLFVGGPMIDGRDCALPNICEDDLGAGLLMVLWTVASGVISAVVGGAYFLISGTMKARHTRDGQRP